MRYLSVCSGIEAATVAWHPLGWAPEAFAEIEPFPRAVLAHHHPTVPNLGDITKFKDWPDAAIDLLVGGTPCQSFSVAGLRKGLADPRGNLALTFLGIADRYGPEWLIWENVPGVLSLDKGRAFGSILGGMAELGYRVSYRVLDAQYVRVDGFGRAVPQRRRRVFVVGNSRDWRRSAAVLFEPESLSGNLAPRRETGKTVAPTISARPTGGGGLGTDFDIDGGLVARSLNAHPNRSDGESETFVAHPLLAKGNSSHDDSMETYVAHTLRAEGFDRGQDGTEALVPVVAASLTRGAESSGKGGYAGRRQEDDVNLVALMDERNITSKANRASGRADVAPTMHADPFSVAFSITPSNSNEDYNAREASKAQALTSSGNRPSARGGDLIATRWAVRRLMPIECERLQGFPDGYTDVRYRGKPAKDGPRYKALGNSMAVPVMRWLGRRIEMVTQS